MQHSNTQETSIFLSLTEVIDLTHRRTRNSQVSALRQMGIDHKVRPDGSLVVLRAHIEKTFGATLATGKIKKKSEPDWSALHAEKT